MNGNHRAPLLSRDATASLSDQLAFRLAEQIEQRLLGPGSRLPSIRGCAARHGVSPSTVVAAYDKLQAQGLVQALPQRGFFVRETIAQAGVDQASAAQASARLPPLPISATTLMRGMFQAPGQRPMPGLGTLPVEWLDLPMLSQALKKVCSSARLGELTMQYGEPAGDLRLRRALAQLLAERGIATGPDQLITTVGATHALDVVTRSLLRAGDTVLVDEPGWSVEFARLGALGLRTLPVPRHADGPDLEMMGRLIEAQPAESRPRLYVTVSVLHNPTGGSITLQNAHRLLQLAQKYSLHILEDDSYAHLAPPHLPRLAALDALERTILIGGFSKILAPSFRVGYIAAPNALVERFTDTKLLSTLTTPTLTEQALASCLETGRMRRHAERIRQKLDAARSRSAFLAEAHGCRFAATPRGLFGWLDVGCDTERLAQRMHDDGWLLAPGSLFHATPRPTSLMRINFATTQDERFWIALDAARTELRGLRPGAPEAAHRAAPDEFAGARI